MKSITLMVTLMIIGLIGAITFYASIFFYQDLCFLKGAILSNIIQVIAIIMAIKI